MIDVRSEKPATAADIARHFGVSPATVRRWMRIGLEHCRVGGSVFTSWEAVSRFTRHAGPAIQVSRPSDDIAACIAKHG